MILCFAVGAVHILHALTLDRIIEYREISFTSPRWPENLDGYRIAFLTDIHTISDESLGNVAERLNSLNIDIMLLGGDFSVHDYKYRQSISILSGVATTDGIFGVEGNHDYHVRLFSAMEDYGIIPLFNSGYSVQEGFFLAGVKDLWNHPESISIEEAVYGADANDFVLLLSHNPDVTMMQSTHSVDLVLSGHTHGGHISFFGIWAPYFTFRSSITAFGQRFKTGWSSSRDGVPVYVSNGVGDYYNIPRVFARPQVILLTLNYGERVSVNTYSPFLLSGLGIMTVFLLAWNCYAFSLFALDKKRAAMKKSRIREATLISHAFMMGGAGAMFGMMLCRHKSRRTLFRILIPLAVSLNFGVLSFFLFRLFF